VRRWTSLGLLCLAACSGDGTATSHAGTLALTLTAGGGNDGAIVLLVSGGPVTQAGAPAGYEIGSNTDAAGTHLIIVGNLTAGVVATIAVPDVSRAAAYVVTVTQVADRTSFGLLDPARYNVTVGPTP
jgi:hypothetical protein